MVWTDGDNKFVYSVLPEHVGTFTTLLKSTLKSSKASHLEHIC